MRAPLLLTALLLLAACSDDPTPVKADMGPADMAADQSVTPDLADDMSPDQSTPDDMNQDQDSADMAADLADDMTTDDMSSDMATDDMSADMNMPDMAEPDPRCMYLDLDVIYVSCAPLDMYSLLRRFVDPDLGDALCPPYYMLKGVKYPTAEAAMSAQQCDASCQYVASQSATFLHCERRNGYIKFTADGCADIYEFAEGIYDSLDQWRMSHPCPG